MSFANITDLRRRSLADMGLLLAAVIWGSGFVVNKEVLRQVDPFVLLAWRFSLAAGLLGGYLLLRQQPLWSFFRSGVVLGTILWVTFALQLFGLTLTTASNSGFITSLFVLITPILSLLFLRESINLGKGISMALATAGLWLVTGGITRMGPGDSLTFGVAVLFSIYFLMAGHLVKKRASALVLAFQQFVTAAGLSWIAILLLGISVNELPRETVWGIAYIGIMQTLVAFGLQLVAQKYTTPTRVSFLLTLEAPFAALFAWTLGREVFQPERAFGGLLIVIATIISSTRVHEVMTHWWTDLRFRSNTSSLGHRRSNIK